DGYPDAEPDEVDEPWFHEPSGGGSGCPHDAHADRLPDDHCESEGKPEDPQQAMSRQRAFKAGHAWTFEPGHHPDVSIPSGRSHKSKTCTWPASPHSTILPLPMASTSLLVAAVAISTRREGSATGSPARRAPSAADSASRG